RFLPSRWPLVQRQDTRLWTWEGRFESTRANFMNRFVVATLAWTTRLLAQTTPHDPSRGNSAAVHSRNPPAWLAPYFETAALRRRHHPCHRQMDRPGPDRHPRAFLPDRLGGRPTGRPRPASPLPL